MKIFTVYQNPNAKYEEDAIILVPESFSWWGFLFPFNILWGLKNQCWLFTTLAAGLFIIYIASLLHPYAAGEYINASKLPAQLALGLFANDFHRLSLQKRGYKMAGIIAANKADEALRNYLQKS